MKVSKSATFLFELMVVILVFTAAAAICTSIFANAYVLSTHSENVTMAVVKAESAAEEFKAGILTGNETEQYYDKSWALIEDKNKANYILSIKLSTSAQAGSKDVTQADIEVTNLHPAKGQDVLYTLQAMKYTG